MAYELGPPPPCAVCGAPATMVSVNSVGNWNMGAITNRWYCAEHDPYAAVREFLPSHDPDKMDHGLALELAVDRTRDGVIAAAREICGNVDAVAGEEYIQALEDALAGYDAAVAENQAHDSRVWGEE